MGGNRFSFNSIIEQTRIEYKPHLDAEKRDEVQFVHPTPHFSRLIPGFSKAVDIDWRLRLFVIQAEVQGLVGTTASW